MYAQQLPFRIFTIISFTGNIYLFLLNKFLLFKQIPPIVQTCENQVNNLPSFTVELHMREHYYVLTAKIISQRFSTVNILSI